ncbi:MAG: hypothetical protein WDO24_19365 [Pseudomonadota bacterium]
MRRESDVEQVASSHGFVIAQRPAAPDRQPGAAFLLGAALLVAIPLGLQMMTAQGDQLLPDPRHGDGCADRGAAGPDGARVRSSRLCAARRCRGAAPGRDLDRRGARPGRQRILPVEIDRKDGQILRVDVRR